MAGGVGQGRELLRTGVGVGAEGVVPGDAVAEAPAEGDGDGADGPVVGCAALLGVAVGFAVAEGGGVEAGVGVGFGHGGLPADGSMVKLPVPESLPREPLAASVCWPEPPKHAGAGWVMLPVHRPLPAM